MKKSKITLRERTAFGARLFLCRENAGLTQEQAATLVGMSQGTLHESEKKADSSRKTAQLAQLYSVDAHWLATGEGLPPDWWIYEDKVNYPRISGGVTPVTFPHELNYAGRPQARIRIPVVGTAKLGADGYYFELETPTGFGDGYVEHFSADLNCYGVRVKGDSMHPAIKHGQIVVVEPNGELVPGENVLISLRDGRKMVKELVIGRADSVTVASVNGGDRITFDREEIECIHAVAAVVSASKWRPD